MPAIGILSPRLRQADQDLLLSHVAMSYDAAAAAEGAERCARVASRPAALAAGMQACMKRHEHAPRRPLIVQDLEIGTRSPAVGPGDSVKVPFAPRCAAARAGHRLPLMRRGRQVRYSVYLLSDKHPAGRGQLVGVVGGGADGSVQPTPENEQKLKVEPAVAAAADSSRLTETRCRSSSWARRSARRSQASTRRVARASAGTETASGRAAHRGLLRTQGTTGMMEGGRRFLVVPPHMGYGAQASAVIPASSFLLIELALVKVKARGRSGGRGPPSPHSALAHRSRAPRPRRRTLLRGPPPLSPRPSRRRLWSRLPPRPPSPSAPPRRCRTTAPPRARATRCPSPPTVVR